MRPLALLVPVWFAAGLSACQPDLVVGERACFSDAMATSPIAAAGGASGETLALPWSTSFEKGFCEYLDTGGYCKINADATYALVSAPVRSGKLAAAYTVTGNDTKDALQARCVLRGTLPPSAVYGAWYYFPSYAETVEGKTWNLFHFEGSNGADQHHLWDVSVESSADGELTLYVYDFLNERGKRRPTTRLPLPLAGWVHIEFVLKRAADATGSIELRQNDQSLLAVNDIVTDDSERAEWFVGNFADALTPADSTVYVDDVTIGTAQ